VERRSPRVGLEPVLLLDPDPGQLLLLPRQLVAASRQLLLGLEQLQPRGKPLLTCSNLVISHVSVSLLSLGSSKRPANNRSSSWRHPCQPLACSSRRSSVEIRLLTNSTAVAPSDSLKESSSSCSLDGSSS